eukprot:TRINITY_DN88103_c0_g1_i1.p1 TRINITY_DN88103_c0_g1~~TRINITY_DN88103_c0_g1_i1.p1  ORF type:complete len:918 (-),score=184.93 TRINITY_DN88103_c0_g1_i1:31-2754(-)
MSGYSDGAHRGVVFLCLEASDLLLEPMCSTWELQQELVPYVLSHLLNNPKFLKLQKAERQLKVKTETQRMLSGETGNATGEVSEAEGQEGSEPDDLSPHRFWSHLRSKYGTRLGSIMEMLQLLQPVLQRRHVVVLRFSGEPGIATASLLVRASVACAGPLAGPTAEAAHRDFPQGSFSTAALGTWLQELPSAVRMPPLWARLASASTKFLGNGASEVCALILCAQVESTETTPEALAVAARALRATADDADDVRAPATVPCLTAVTFGPDFTSERLAALEELCAWSGGLSFNVDGAGMLQPAAHGLSSHLFSERGVTSDEGCMEERRRYYAQKQELGTCFMQLPRMVAQGTSSPDVTRVTSLTPKAPGDLAALVAKAASVPLESAVPSESMLAVLSDVTLAIARRWSRSLRIWRMRRGFRDVVFGEPGSIGLDFEEPRFEESASGSTPVSTWRLRATHPPASALKMQEGSELVAINHIRVTERTPRSDVARRISARPVSLTFREPEKAGSKTCPNSDVVPMMLSEIVISELREGQPPLKSSAPPLSTSLKRVAAAKEASSKCNSVRELQAQRILAAVADLGASQQIHTDSLFEAFSSQPGLFFRVLLYCGETIVLAKAGICCRSCQQLLLDSARPSAKQPAKPQQRLWTWSLRWGQGPTPTQRIAFWRWAMSGAWNQEGADNSRQCAVGLSATALAASGTSQSHIAVLQAAARSDAVGLSRLCSGLGGTSPAVPSADAVLRGVTQLVAELPADVLGSLLAEPLHGQKLWMLTDAALPWLVMLCRCFQVAFAAHLPQLFRHLVAEGLAPELFFCRWLQGLFQDCVHAGELLRIWDIFVFERSYKIFVRLALAIFRRLEKSLIGDVERMMDVLFDSKSWNMAEGELLEIALATKVTRSMLHEIESTCLR